MNINVGKTFLGVLIHLSKLCFSKNKCGRNSKNEPSHKRDLYPKPLEKKPETKSNKRLPVEHPPPLQLIRPEQSFKRHRTARIFQQSKNCMQSGTFDTIGWRLQFDRQEEWENPCMGWSSNADGVSGLQMKFATKEQAIAFCQKHNWKWYVDGKQTRKRHKIRPYAENYSHRRRTRVSTK
ncbi:unnamed protein product [Phyllotreta striolata]|uniref:NADH dehydrogenase [ubiquinone] iron-sulfur protein 4, mitochondrial n=1 Tax=Phyllotreta striolata TaxID=444603 RepID=A0A9N9TK21_PHYSR|nr:unnamed protein product [Phyllotreta striolata]